MLIDSGAGALASIVVSERSAQGEESTRLIAEWVRGDEFESAPPTRRRSRPGRASPKGAPRARSRVLSSKGRFEERRTAQVPVLQWPTMLKGGRMAMLAQLVARLRGALKK